MAEDVLLRLLEAEKRAEELVSAADREREAAVRAAIEEARDAERRFERRIPEIQAAFLDQARERAQRAINELSRRYGEHRRKLVEQAGERRDEALDAATALLTDVSRG
jgi:vacuolar-type H+-ATPase subunit H